MTDQHPITPPPELIQKWIDLINYYSPFWKQQLIVNAYQAGADQELEACIELLQADGYQGKAMDLCAARRPKPPSLKEQALALVSHDFSDQPCLSEEGYAIIRRALEQLDG
jgi:hypothetical protein